MKFPEQLGYDPREFSNAVQATTADRETAERLRAGSVVSIDPFVVPEYLDLPPAPRDERPAHGVEEGLLGSDPEDEEVPTEEVDWMILPPGQGDARGPNSGEGTGGSTPGDDEPENLKRLRALVRAWGTGGRVVVSRVEATDGTKYQVAVLPLIVGGIAVEDALADTAADDNTLLAWHGADGIDEDGVVVATWRDVFSGDKKHARAMGAHRIYHTPTTNERINAFFAIPDDGIDELL